MTRKQIGLVLGAVVLAVAAPLLALAVLPGLDGTTQAQGSLVVGIDMDPANTPANDDDTVGSVQRCVMTTAGSSVDFDLYLDEVPSGRNFYAWQADIGYDDTNLTITAQAHTIVGLNLITRTGSGSYIDGSEGVPDPPGGGLAGIHRAGVVPLGGSGVPGPAEGVLGRYTVSVGGATPPGVYSLALSNVAIADQWGEVVAWDELQDAWLAVDVPCDYVKVSMPDFGQHSSSWCWVAAAANSLWWYGENVEGEEGLLGGAGKPWKAIDPLSRNAVGPDVRDPHDLDADTIINEPDGFPDWFDYNDRSEIIPPQPQYDGTCGNKIDEGFVGPIDWPADPICWIGVSDDPDQFIDEDPAQAGLDDDGDGLVDEDQIDGADNDGDTRVDEDPPGGVDDDADGSEGGAGIGTCADRLDNNADTFVDCADPSCAPKCDEDGIVGYRQLLREIANATWHDINLDGFPDPGEPTYVYSEAVEKWDYLLGLKNFVDTNGSNLVVHDIIDPAKCLPGSGFLSDRTTPKLNTRPACNVPGIDQEQRVPALIDYQRELSRSQDVLLWMEGLEGYPEYSHVVTGVAYDQTVPGAWGLGTITIADPWTHTAAPHDDFAWLWWVPMSPDHNNSMSHDPSPYEVCDVMSTGEGESALVITCPGQSWQVVDLIFISPAVADLEKVDLQVKPFYCGDSDMDGDEATGTQADPGFGTCCDGADNDANTLTDGRDWKCFTPMGGGPLPTYINEDWADGADNDGDGAVDEDLYWHPAGQMCPWNGDDDCDGMSSNFWCNAIYAQYGIVWGMPQYCVDEDPKNGVDDDGDGRIDEDPANGFLGVDNDRDPWVDEDGAGRFDFNGDTIIQGCAGAPPNRFCEEQVDGRDDDGDTQIDEDSLDSPLPVNVGEGEVRVHEPHYLIKDQFVNLGPDAVLANHVRKIDAPYWRAYNEDGYSSTCTDGQDNDGDTLIDGADPECLEVHVWAESRGLQTCNDGVDNGGDGKQDEGDEDCQTFTEVSVECENPSDIVTVKQDVPWYVKPRSDDPILQTLPECQQYRHIAGPASDKCVPCKIPAAYFYAFYQMPLPDVVSGASCAALVPPLPPPFNSGYCVAADSVKGVNNELILNEYVELPVNEPVTDEHQFDLSCEGEASAHTFTIQNLIEPPEGVTDPNPLNNNLEMKMEVGCLTFTDGRIDDLLIGGQPPPVTWDVTVSTSNIKTVSADLHNDGPVPMDYTVTLGEISPGLGILNYDEDNDTLVDEDGGPPLHTWGVDDDGDGQVDEDPAGLLDADADTWVDNVEKTLGSHISTSPEGGGESEAAAPGSCADTFDNDGDGFVDAADAGCSTPESTYRPGSCSDGVDNDGWMFPGADLADIKCHDSDVDGHSDVSESQLGSDPANFSKRPEHMQLPWTCGDGIDNDLDGLVDGADLPSCDIGMLQIIPPPVACASGWVPKDTDGDTLVNDAEIISLAGDGTLGVALDMGVFGLMPGTFTTLSRELVFHCFQPGSPYPTETVTASHYPRGAHLVDLNPYNDNTSGTFSGDATCTGGEVELSIPAWGFGPDPPPGFHVNQTHLYPTQKIIRNGGPTSPVDVTVQKSMNVPANCQGSVTAAATGETVKIYPNTMYKMPPDIDWTNSGPGGITLSPAVGQIVYVQGLSDPLHQQDDELQAVVFVEYGVAGDHPVNETFDILCTVPGVAQVDDDGDTLVDEDPPDGRDNDGDTFIDEDAPGYTFQFANQVLPVGWPNVVCETDVTNNRSEVTKDVDVLPPPPQADLEKLELYVKPFYCGDSDMDGDEASGAQVTPGTGTCCDGADNDGNTLTDGQDFKCFGPPPPPPIRRINEDGGPPWGAWGVDNDGDSLIDEDPWFYQSGQFCPWNGDDDCDGMIGPPNNPWCDAIYGPLGIVFGMPQYCVDEDPKNGIDDDGDGSEGGAGLGTCKDNIDNNADGKVDCADPTCAPKCDEDPANGFLGLDNDGDGRVDEDGAGSFDWDGDTDPDPPVQSEGFDDDADTQVDEDPLDSAVVYDPPPITTVKWVQPYDPTPNGLDVVASHPFVLADDFVCTKTGPITQIDFWGSWYHDLLPDGDAENVTFILSIHPDVPAGEPPSYSHPGPMAWTQTFDPHECEATSMPIPPPGEGWFQLPPGPYEPAADLNIWHYTCPVPEPQFMQLGTEQAPIIYWLDVQAIPTGGVAHFGWKTSNPNPPQHGDDAVWAVGAEPIDPLNWMELHYPMLHPYEGESINLAFVITGEEDQAPVIHEPHYLVKERLVNNGPYGPVAAVQNEMLNAPAWRANAQEDGRTTCNDLWDNDNDGEVDAEDPNCLDPKGEERPDLHACNDGWDNGVFVGQGDGLADEGDPDCATLTEVSVECKEPSDSIQVNPGVLWYIKPPSNDPILLTRSECAQYYDSNPQHPVNKCVPCKIPMGPGTVPQPCASLPPWNPGGSGYCIAADSLPGLSWQELLLNQQVEELKVDEPVVNENQSDLSCEGETSLHKFRIVGEVLSTGQYEDPNPDNNALGMDMLVACTQWAWGQVNDLRVPLPDESGTKWHVEVSKSEDLTVQVDVSNASTYSADFVLALQEESPPLTGLADSDGDTWVDPVEHIMFSDEYTTPENGGESEAIGPGYCTDNIDNDGDGFKDAADAGCSTPEFVHARGTCNDGQDNDKDGDPDAADMWCEDFDNDGYSNPEEGYMFGSNPIVSTSTPEFMQFPWTCNDGIDNDGDGKCDDVGGCQPGMPAEPDDNSDGKADCSASQLSGIEPPVTCVSGWAREDLNPADGRPDGTDSEYVYMANDGTVTVGLDIPLPGLMGGPITVSRNLVLDCPIPATPYPPETVRATIRPADVHQMDLNPADDERFTTFDGDATCGLPNADLTVDSWTFNYTPDPNFHVGEELPVHAAKVIHNSGPASPVDVKEQKWLNIPEDCDVSLHIDHSETVSIADDVWYNVGLGFDATFPDDWSQGPITLSPPADTVYLRGLPGNVNEVDAWFTITNVSGSQKTVDEYFDIHCRKAASYDYLFHNQITPAEYPDRCDPTPGDITGDGTVHVDVAPDGDQDTWPDDIDNCPKDANPDQLDTDGDGAGNACDPDDDGDGFWDPDEGDKGSDDLDAASTPEHCDYVDNDLNEGIDEGYDRSQPGGGAPNGTPDCQEGVDTDGDTLLNPDDDDDDTPVLTNCLVWDGNAKDCIDDEVERHLSTDELADCYTDYGTDAWPFDIAIDGSADVGDIMMFKPSILTTPVDLYWNVRLDIVADLSIDVADILMYKPVILTTCGP